jgi:hypothetical protein
LLYSLSSRTTSAHRRRPEVSNIFLHSRRPESSRSELGDFDLVSAPSGSLRPDKPCLGNGEPAPFIYDATRPTGEEIWVVEITATPTTGIDIQPVVYDGLVFASTVSVSIGGIYVGGDRGVLHALGEAGVVVGIDPADGTPPWETAVGRHGLRRHAQRPDHPRARCHRLLRQRSGYPARASPPQIVAYRVRS